jgi:hypothetical protein
MAEMPSFLRPPVWTNQDLILYHATINLYISSIRNRIDVMRGRPKRDFGQGFYTTTKRRQAQAWAWRCAIEYSDENPLSRRRPRPMIVRFGVDRDAIAGLETLSFVRGDHEAADFWSFVHHCRSGEIGHARSVPPNPGEWYDVVVGPVAAFWDMNLMIADSDQMSFHTPRGADLLGRSLTSVQGIS